jgi:phage terminase large subunit
MSNPNKDITDRLNSLDLSKYSKAAIEMLLSTNLNFFPLYDDQSRYLVMKGGGGSGKSIFAGRKVLERAAENRKHKFLVVRKTAKTLRESCYSQLKQQIADHFPKGMFKCLDGDIKIINNHNGNEIVFSGLDDVEKLKSIYAITDIWIEEATELLEEDFDQLDIRCREKPSDYNQIILSFNPISALHWLKRRFFDNTPLNCKIHQSTYKDNRFLSPQSIQVLEAFKTTNPYYYSVYCLNQWGVYGNCVFDKELIARRLQEITQPISEGSFTYDLTYGIDTKHIIVQNIRWVERAGGIIKIYKQPTDYGRYVLSGDTAGSGSDYFTGQLMDNNTSEFVAVLRQLNDSELYSEQMYCLGKYYNWALIGLEINFDEAANRYLRRLGYPNLFLRTAERDYRERSDHDFGWLTGGNNREYMITEAVEFFKKYPMCINDRLTLEEMLTFVYNDKKNGRREAEDGAHDDLVMAFCICLQIRKQQGIYIPERAEVERLNPYDLDYDNDDNDYNDTLQVI